LKRRTDRIRKIAEAIAGLEADAQARAAAEQARRDAADAQREAEGRRRPGKAPAPATTYSSQARGDSQTTCPAIGAKIMKRSNNGLDYCFNGQAVVDSKHQFIMAAEVMAAANDKQQAVALAKAALENLAAANIERPRDANGNLLLILNTADSGYNSEENVRQVEQLDFDPQYAFGRQKHYEPEPPTTIPVQAAMPASPTDRTAQTLRTEAGRKLNAARKHIVESVP
jgi:hypothetical protein